MPFYTFQNIETGDFETHSMSYLELDKFSTENPHLKQTLCTPAIGDSVRLGVRKVPDGFNDILKNAKKKNLHSTIETRN